MSAFRSKKDYTSVTVEVENYTSEQYDEDEFSGIPEIVEPIRIRDEVAAGAGSREAARALRKKLKYGNIHRQLRALTILDGLLQNAGPQFQQTLNSDQMLLERLRICATSDLSDRLVKAKCQVLFRQWTRYQALKTVSSLHKQTYNRETGKVVKRDESKVVRETDNPFGDDDDEDEKAPPPHSRHTSLSQGHPSGSITPPRPSFFSPTSTVTSTMAISSKAKKDKKSKKKNKPFNLESEKESIKACIADSSMASTNLLNALRSINREHERISDNAAAVQNFENCKLLRRKILRFVHHVTAEISPTAEQFTGALLHANDELVIALMTFEQLDRSLDADSDSDDEMAQQAHAYKMLTENKGKANDDSFASNQLASLHISPRAPNPEKRPPPPPRPVQRPPPQKEEILDEEDEDDPFADRNELQTPQLEKDEPRWRVV